MVNGPNSSSEGKMEENIGESMMRKFVHKVFRKSDNIGNDVVSQPVNAWKGRRVDTEPAGRFL